jgi:hypothetical protein
MAAREVRHETMKTPLQRWLVRLSVVLYGWLLYAYPAAFRREYGREMALLFHDYCRASMGERGAWGLLLCWSVTLGDFFQSLFREHLVPEGSMRHKTRVQWGALVACVMLCTLNLLYTLINLDVIVDDPLWAMSASRQLVPVVLVACFPVVGGLYSVYGAVLGRLARGALLLCLGSMGILLLHELIPSSSYFHPERNLLGPVSLSDVAAVGLHLGFGLFSLRTAGVRALGWWRVVPLGMSSMIVFYALSWRTLPVGTPHVVFLAFVAGCMFLAWVIWRAPAAQAPPRAAER